MRRGTMMDRFLASSICHAVIGGKWNRGTAARSEGDGGGPEAAAGSQRGEDREQDKLHTPSQPRQLITGG